MDNVNENGQRVESFNQRRNVEKCSDELIGLSKGLLADGILHPSEVDFLITWMEANQHISEAWPACVLYERVGRFLEDGIIDDAERKELFELLSQLTFDQLKENCSTGLPLDDPQPKIEFENSIFVVTGKFAYGPRSEIEKLILDRGGELAKSITKKVDYLVIGTFSSRDADEGVAIISEDHFIKSCFNN